MRRFDEFRGESEGEFCRWLQLILFNKLRRARTRTVEPLIIDPVSEADSVEDEIAFDELVSDLHAALFKLRLPERIVTELRLRGAATQEIACMLDLTIEAVRKRESRAVARLRTILEH